MYFKVFLAFFLFWPIVVNVFGQSSIREFSSKDRELIFSSDPKLTSQWNTPYSSHIILLSQNIKPNTILLYSKTAVNQGIFHLKPFSMPAAFDYQELAVFCKLEYKMEKVFKFPVKIRLGEVHYTERMEGKGGIDKY